MDHGCSLRGNGVQQPLVEVRELAQRPRHIRLIRQPTTDLSHLGPLKSTSKGA